MFFLLPLVLLPLSPPHSPKNHPPPHCNGNGKRQAGVGSWVFIGSLFPSVIFFFMALAASVVYNIAPHQCPTAFRVFYIAFVVLAYVYVFSYAFLLLGPAVSSLARVLVFYIVYAALVFGFCAVGALELSELGHRIWATTASVEELLDCHESPVFVAAVAMVVVYGLYLLAFVVVIILVASAVNSNSGVKKQETAGGGGAGGGCCSSCACLRTDADLVRAQVKGGDKGGDGGGGGSGATNEHGEEAEEEEEGGGDEDEDGSDEGGGRRGAGDGQEEEDAEGGAEDDEDHEQKNNNFKPPASASSSSSSTSSSSAAAASSSSSSASSSSSSSSAAAGAAAIVAPDPTAYFTPSAPSLVPPTASKSLLRLRVRQGQSGRPG